MRWVLLLAMAGSACAQCTYTLSQATFNVGAGDATGALTGLAGVITDPACPWTAQSQATWLHVNLGQSGTGTGSVGWSIDRNPLPAARTGNIVVATQTITVNQAAAVCTYTLPTSPASFPVGGGSGTLQVKATCAWGVAAPSNQPWITIPPNSGGIFDGTLNYTVAANPCVASRSGVIGVGLPGGQVTQTQTINQDGSPNNLVLAPTSANVGAAASDGQITVTIGNGCAFWTASSDVSWLHITTATPGTTVGLLTYHVDANPSSARSGNLHIGPQTFPVTQQAVPPPAMQLTAVTNAANGAQGAVSPGEIVSLFGTALGPTAGVGLQLSSDGKSVTTTLGGVQVFFDGAAAALTYASATQVNAVVPYGVAGNSSTQVKVQYQGNASNSMTLNVQAATPAIFTLDSSGLGPGAILNQDYSVNTSANRAARGSVVQIYCTGGGVTNPPSSDASLTGTPLPLLVTQPVQVTIGGMTAQVQYAGGAPTAIAGLTQINATVPANVTPAAAVPVVVQIGNWQSQAGVTLSVR